MGAVQDRAGNTMGGLIAVGLAILFVGAFVAAIAWPHELVTVGGTTRLGDVLPDTVEKTGNPLAAVAGGILAGIGLLILNVGLTAWAVSIGNRHAR